MEGLSQTQALWSNGEENHFKSVRRNSSESSEPFSTSGARARGFADNLESSDEDLPKKRFLKRVKRFSDSDSESSKDKIQNEVLSPEETTSRPGKSILQSNDSESDTNPTKTLPQQSSTIMNYSDTDKSDSDDEVSEHHVHIKNNINKLLEDNGSKKLTTIISDGKIENNDDENDYAVKNKEQQLRMKNKRNKLKNKFKSLLQTRGKDLSPTNNEEIYGKSNKDSSSESGGEMSSIEKIKQKIKERISFKSSICDPDTSDEENIQQKAVHKPKKERKIKITSPKPQRMSAKQAMENMQKIKSESNRMLREKEVSLPYHRPKALSLKDIMSRRKLAVSSDGKALPIKMNGEQLKQYAQMLEERQKEIIELCKSDSEEEEINGNPSEDVNKNNENSTGVVKSNIENHEELKDKSESEEERTNKIPTRDLNDNSEHFAEVLKSTAENYDEIKDTIEHSKVDTATEAIENCIEKESAHASSATNVLKYTSTDVPMTDSPYNHTKNEQQELSSTENVVSSVVHNQNTAKVLEDSESNMKLVFNDSANSTIDENLSADVEMSVLDTTNENKVLSKGNVSVEEFNISSKSEALHKDSVKNNTELESQLISLHVDIKNTIDSNIIDATDGPAKESIENSTINCNTKPADQERPENAAQSTEEYFEINSNNINPRPESSNQDNENELSNQDNEKNGVNEVTREDSEFSDDDINMEDIDKIIENAEIIKDIEDKVNSQFLVRDKPLNLNPKLTGSPGMVIDLDDNDLAPKKSGVELLKERFTYFSKLKTPEELEREREKKLKPGTQLKKLKHELEEKIAELRSLEWAKRLDEEKQQQKELKELRGEESDEDDIDKIEAAIEEKEGTKEVLDESDSEEEEPIEDDIEISDKPRVKNALVYDEAEESDYDENESKAEDEDNNDNDVEKKEDDDDSERSDDDESESYSDESSDSENEQTLPKKGRILKAFEDSDEEDANQLEEQSIAEDKDAEGVNEPKIGSSSDRNFVASQISSQDEELQLAQRLKSTSDDLLTSQESVLIASEAKGHAKDVESDEAFTQTFSILDTSKPQTADIDLNSSDKTTVDVTQSLDINTVGDDLCPMLNSHLPLPSQIPTTQISQSQPIGEDVIALCTGQFYNNQFVSQLENLPGSSQNYDAFDKCISQDSQDGNESQEHVSIEEEKDTAICPNLDNFIELNSTENSKTMKNTKDVDLDPQDTEKVTKLNNIVENNEVKLSDDNLKSILDELADPEFDSPKPNKFFIGNNIHRDEVHTEIQMKRKLVIESDEETDDGAANEPKKRKKLKKKKAEKRALQISDDEEQSEQEEIEEYESEIEEDNVDRLVEYDSEENEIEVKALNPKKKRKMAEFFENEAELTSEDEWVGSGDEDEAGLDRMEREEGDDDTFHQGTLQRELEQIHMRDVLDQDKREVRLIQELLFEDGDLGAGGRQRKFKWNYMGDEELGTVPDEFADTQEEEFESEEQWRKQRHEREMFLRQLKNKDDPDDSLNVSINRTTIIKANLLSKTMSSLLTVASPASDKTGEKTESPPVKKTSKDIPSPKKPFSLLQQIYQGGVLSRGRGALARLAALATPLAADEDKATVGSSSRGNFVFATLTPGEKQPKATKRRAESNPDTPKLVKKLRTEEKNNSRNSLLDHFKL